MSKIRVFIKHPGEDPFMTPIENDVETLKKYVGDVIARITLCSDFAVICNGDGVFSNEKFNFAIGKHQFFGTVIFVGLKDDEVTHVPCTYSKFREMFKNLYSKERKIDYANRN